MDSKQIAKHSLKYLQKLSNFGYCKSSCGPCPQPQHHSTLHILHCLHKQRKEKVTIRKKLQFGASVGPITYLQRSTRK